MDKINKIKIGLCVFIWIAVAVAVIVTVFITKKASCLWAFAIPAFVMCYAIDFSVKASNNDADDDSESDY